ncbi:MAG TPA: hypothetical protein DCY13_10890, partial [Verrucomicrobiales bacterium]|nr:hypothetical protein [Verrucomicrobiales bacterium]
MGIDGVRRAKISTVKTMTCPKPHFVLLLGLVFIMASLESAVGAATNSPSSQTNQLSMVISAEGLVERRARGSAEWLAAKVNDALRDGDQLRTGARSRAAVRLSNHSV